MMYYDSIKKFQEKILSYSNEIFKVYGNELQLKLEDYNLLSNQHNCLESSTAFGYIIEEFLVSKLEIYTQNHKPSNNYKILRTNQSTTISSYDCFSNINNDILALINIKAEKNNNNAIASINALFNDYVINEEKIEKCYLILKINYNVAISNKDNQRKIFIKNINSFFLEEIDFSKEHKQDHRNWSREFQSNSGRLQVSNTFKNSHKLDINNISYKNTCKMLKIIKERV